MEAANVSPSSRADKPVAPEGDTDVADVAAPSVSGDSGAPDTAGTSHTSNVPSEPGASPQDPFATQNHSKSDELAVLEITERIKAESRVRTHYYVKIAVSAFLCALLLIIGVPVFMISRMTGSLSYTALGVVLVGFGLILAVAVLVLLFRPPWRKTN